MGRRCSLECVFAPRFASYQPAQFESLLSLLDNPLLRNSESLLSLLDDLLLCNSEDTLLRVNRSKEAQTEIEDFISNYEKHLKNWKQFENDVNARLSHLENQWQTQAATLLSDMKKESEVLMQEQMELVAHTHVLRNIFETEVLAVLKALRRELLASHSPPTTSPSRVDSSNRGGGDEGSSGSMQP